MASKFLSAAALAVGVAASPASATVYSFTLTGAVNEVFMIEKAPADARPLGFGFIIADFSGAGGVRPAFDLGFRLGSFGGGMFALPPQSQSPVFNLTGPQVFAGSLDAPSFKLGTFSLSVDGSSEQVQLIISETVISPIPETSTWIMLTSGFAFAGYGLRKGRVRGRPLLGSGPIDVRIAI